MSMTADMEIDRTEWHLDNWARWMRETGLPGLFYASRAAVVGASGSSDFDAMVANADTRCAAAVDAIVDGLPKPLHAAVHHVRLGTVWRERVEPRPLYEEARTSVGRALTTRGVW